jgi:hypothetical protein
MVPGVLSPGVKRDRDGMKFRHKKSSGTLYRDIPAHFELYYRYQPKKKNVVADWLTLLLHIREVLGSILGPGDRLS